MSSSSSSQEAGPSTPSSPPPPPSAFITSLRSFADHLRENEHVLATQDGDQTLANQALSATKGIFDHGLSLERSSHPHIHLLITQLLDPESTSSSSANNPSTRPTTRASRKKKSTHPSSSQILPLTPLGELFTGFEDTFGPVWNQLEIKTGKVGDVLKVLEIGTGVQPDDDEDEQPRRNRQQQEDDDDEQEDEGDDEDEEDDLTPEEKEQWEALLREKPEMFSEWESDEEEGDEEEGMDVDLDEDDEDDEEGDDLMDDEEEDDLMQGMDEDEDEDEDEDDDDDEEDDEPLGASRSKPNHPTLDDQFFSIDAFNRYTEVAEATSASSGSLGSKKKKPSNLSTKRKGPLGEEDEEEDDDEEDELGLDDDVGDLFSGDILGEAGDEGDNMMYSDFFPPPREWTREKPTKGKGAGKDDKLKSKKNKDKKEKSKPDVEPELDGRDIMSRVRTDLFADDDEAEEQAVEERLSTHEKRQRALQDQIAAFEQENVGKKEWTLLGEVKSRDRPQNSMLEEDLEFEQTGKVVPIVTEEKVVGLEEMIKRRILDGNFDDVVRRRELDDKAFIPSRYFELENSASTKSLSQIYEDDYKNATGDGKVQDARDLKLNKDHDEIEALWGEICYKLDALSNLNFTPKQPKAAITTLSNVATTSMENALPTTQSTSTMLAPEELFAPASKSDLVARSELDPLAKKRMRAKDRKTRMHQRQALDSAVDKFAGKSGGGGKARGGVKSQKDRALKELVKTGKGVTVVGKDSVKKPRRNDSSRENVSQSSTLKL